MLQLLIDNQLLLLVVVAAFGYLIGQVKVKGSSLGVAGVLFAGLAVGALDPALKLPEFTTLLGLVLFVYAVGLSSGPGFFASFRRKGLRDNLLVLGVLTLAFGLTIAAWYVLDLEAAVAAGLYAGSLTNTPALAGLLEYVRATLPPELVQAVIDEPVIGYSIAYPVGVVGVIAAIFFTQRLWKVDYAAEAAALHDVGPSGQALKSYSIRVTRPDAAARTVQDLVEGEGWDVRFGRVQHGDGAQALVEADTRLRVGDLVSVVAAEEDFGPVVAYLGEPASERLESDRSQYDFRRIFVSKSGVTGRPVRSLRVLKSYDAIITRVRRGDVEWLVDGDTVLEPGDRVRVVARPEDMAAISKQFGDSYKALSEVNLLTLSLGLLAGLLVGMIPLPLPGGITFRLGLAGGPLIAGLVLGRLGRTGPLAWYLPYSANLLLRQLGLVLFFAGVGTRAGYAFFSTLSQGGGLAVFAAGAVITCTTALLMLWLGYKLFRIPMGLLVGMLAGLHTQPAVLSYALDQSRNELPNIGYATVFPIATIAKILFAQLLLVLLV
ncbi:MAG: aspartate:alanine exchanger family transporter [Rhodothermales bacterium]